jgi:site-specific DNA recombinase
MMNAIGYVRISKKDQSLYSLDAQESLIKDYCTKNKLSLSAVFRDDGESSYSFDRPDYLALERFIKQHNGSVHYLIIKDHDRFSRNISEALEKITSLEKKFGVKVIAVDEPITIDTTDPNIFLSRAFKYLMANHELLNIRKRTKQGIRNAISSGRVVNNAPFGYINIRDGQGKPTLKIDEAKAIAVKRIFEQFINGVSLPLIKSEAKTNGFSRSGNSAIMRILTNPTYAGLLKLPAYGGEPEKLVKAIHQPIVSESIFWIANEKISGFQKYRSRPKEEFPLRGIFRCDCGLHLTASYSKGKRKHYMYYSCPKERNRNYRGEKLHELMDEVLLGLSFNEEQLVKIGQFAKEEMKAQLKEKTLLIDAKVQKLNVLNTKISKLEDRLINDEIDSATYKKWRTKLGADKGNLELEISNLSNVNHNYFERLDAAIPLLINLKNLYHSITLSAKQTLLKRVFELGLIYDGSKLRTPKIHEALMHKLLFVEQPSKIFGDLTGCTAYGIRTRITTVKGWCPSP